LGAIVCGFEICRGYALYGPSHSSSLLSLFSFVARSLFCLDSTPLTVVYISSTVIVLSAGQILLPGYRRSASENGS